MKYVTLCTIIVILSGCLYGDNAKKHSGLTFYKMRRSHHVDGKNVPFNHRTHSRSKRFIRRYLINDCEVSDWSEWSECDAYCGPGHSQRSRMLFSRPVGMDEQDWPKTMEIKTCIGQTCEDACKATEWSDWNECSATCGLGTRVKSRSAAEKDPHPMCSRLQLTKYDKCTVAPCEEINCNSLKWTEWSRCEPDCGHRQQKRHRFGQSTNECKPEVRPCKTTDCHRDCQVSEWGSWSKCDLLCKNERNRTKLHDGSGSGKRCESMRFVESADCNDGCEPCKHTEWTDWSSCSVNLPCHKGTMLRIRSRKRPDLLSGKCIVRMQKDYKDCTVTKGCKKDCLYSAWSEWSPCNKESCIRDIVSYRNRAIQQTAEGAGIPCQKYLKEEKDCPVPPKCSQGNHNNKTGVQQDAAQSRNPSDKTIAQRDTAPSRNMIKVDAHDSSDNTAVDVESGSTESVKNKESIQHIANAPFGSTASFMKSTSFMHIFLIVALCLLL